jgi:MarR family transcriptional regulator, transcriptional regulator for hemolysin
MEKLEQVLFYTLEKAIKTYRQFAQKQINEYELGITIDQWLILKTLQENPDISQQQVAEKIFKDFASVTRMIELLVSKEYLKRDFHLIDRRRFSLSITKKGNKILETLVPIITNNRKIALQAFTANEIKAMQKSLLKIIENCKLNNAVIE